MNDLAIDPIEPVARLAPTMPLPNPQEPSARRRSH